MSLFKRYLLGFSSVFLVLFASACNKPAQVAPPVVDCKTMGVIPPHCCDNAAAAGCPGGGAGSNAALNNLKGVVGTMGMLDKGNDTQQKIIGDLNGVKRNGENLNLAVAKLNAAAPNDPASADREANRPAEVFMGGGGGAKSGAAGGAGSAKGGSIGGALALKTSGSDGSGNTSAATAGMDTNQSGAYASGGGAGRAGKGSGSSWAFGGDLGGGAGSGKPSDVQFKGAGDEVSPLGSEDPEDYFARLSMADSLFKIVERRYVSKQEAWVRADHASTVSRSKQH